MPTSISYRPREDLVQTCGEFNPNSSRADAVMTGAVDANTTGPAGAPVRAEIKYRAGDGHCSCPPESTARQGACKFRCCLVWEIVRGRGRAPQARPEEAWLSGSRKWRVQSSPQKPHLRLRWLEVVGNDDSPGALYEWDDGDFQGAGTIDEGCNPNSVLCTAEMTPETSDDDQIERCRLSH